MPPRLNIPPITRGLLVALFVQSSLSAVIRYRQWTKDSDIVVPYLTLIPQLSAFYPWTFLSTTLVENNVFTLAITAVTIYYGGRYLERAWTSPEFAKFLVVVSLIPNLLTFALLIILFAATGDMTWSLTTIAGGVPLQTSFLIAFSQLLPAHTVTLFRGVLSLRVPRLPLLYLALTTLLAPTPFLTCAAPLLSLFAFLTSWTYLRFYKSSFPDLDSSQSPSLRGDPSETFAFAEFFPEPLRPAISAISSTTFDILVSMRICTPFSATDYATQQQHQHLGGGGGGIGAYRPAPVPGSTRAETERRRALALKALDQRLHAATAQAAKTGGQSQQSGEVTAQQPSLKTQTAMAAQAGGGAGGLLGETSYVPEGDGEDGKGGGS